MAVPGNLASPGLRIVGGLIDVVILVIVIGIVEGITRGGHGASGVIDLAVALAYFGYFWSSRGQTIGMMVFGFRVRDIQTGQFPSVGKAVLRGFIWWLEVGFTICIIGAIGWLWQLWDPQRQAIHDKVAGTIVTTS
ncbi:MAG TPA: RDD family protein [Candidatus Limnocylindrales bacterium]|nr:RDD family protein [Candidatus Limnocylindrales bacterium]